MQPKEPAIAAIKKPQVTFTLKEPLSASPDPFHILSSDFCLLIPVLFPRIPPADCLSAVLKLGT